MQAWAKLVSAHGAVSALVARAEVWASLESAWAWVQAEVWASLELAWAWAQAEVLAAQPLPRSTR